METQQKNKLFDLAVKQNPVKPFIMEVYTKDFETKSGTTLKGKPYEFHLVQVYLHSHEKPYPNEFTLQFSSLAEILPVGFYSWNANKSIGFSAFGTLELDDRKVKPMPIVDF